MYLTFTSMLFNMWPDYRIISKPFTQVFIVLVIKASKVDLRILCQFDWTLSSNSLSGKILIINS